MISTMLSGTAGTSLPESGRPPARAPWPGSLHPARVTADPDTVKCASPAARQDPAQVARHLCPPAAPAATGLLARHATRPGLSHEPAPGEPSLGQAPAGETAATVIPRGSARTAGIPAGDAASIRAAMPAGPPSPQVACRRSDTDPPTGIRPQPPPPRLQPRRGNAERDDDGNALRALTTPTRNPNPGPALQAETRVARLGPGDRDYLPGLLSIRDTG